MASRTGRGQAGAWVLLLAWTGGCSLVDAADPPRAPELISDPRPLEEACSHEDYEVALRRFAEALENGDTADAGSLLEEPSDLRYLRIVDDVPVEERDLDVEDLVAFVETVPGERLRFDILFVNSVADRGEDTPAREFSARPVDFPGLVRGTVTCVDGRAGLDQWLVIEGEDLHADLEASWPCDATARGACYRY